MKKQSEIKSRKTNMARKLGKYCFIRSKETGEVLEVQGKRSGSSVVTEVSRDESRDNASQLWYVDAETQSIRNKLTGFVLDHNQTGKEIYVNKKSWKL